MASRVPPERPGWAEVSVGLIVLSVVGFGGGALIAQLPIDPVFIGLVFTGLTGVAGLAGFYAAFFLRIRSLTAFGVRPTSMRWLIVAGGVGLIAFVAKSAAILLYIWMTGDGTSPQDIYATGASGGLWTAILATCLFSFLTPLGEEFLFRGVVASALLRYGALVGVAGSALIFAIFHGLNVVFPAAFVVGLVAGEIFRRSGSVWPAFVVHAVVNLPTIPVMVLASAAQSQ
jgi:membrane protease YdiL (CAAX protease family)